MGRRVADRAAATAPGGARVVAALGARRSLRAPSAWTDTGYGARPNLEVYRLLFGVPAFWVIKGKDLNPFLLGLIGWGRGKGLRI